MQFQITALVASLLISPILAVPVTGTNDFVARSVAAIRSADEYLAARQCTSPSCANPAWYVFLSFSPFLTFGLNRHETHMLTFLQCPNLVRPPRNRQGSFLCQLGPRQLWGSHERFVVLLLSSFRMVLVEAFKGDNLTTSFFLKISCVRSFQLVFLEWVFENCIWATLAFQNAWKEFTLSLTWHSIDRQTFEKRSQA